MPVHAPARNGVAVVLFVILTIYTTKCLVEATEDIDLQSLSSAQLAELERSTLQKVQKSEGELASLRSQTDALRTEARSITQEADHLQGARDWEEKVKKQREVELEEAKKDVRVKQERIEQMSSRVNELRDQISALQTRLQQLTRERDMTARRYQEPSIKDVLDSRSQQWGTVTRSVYNKTVNNLMPVVEGMSQTAKKYRTSVSKTSPVLELLASTLLYGFLIAAALVIHKMYTKVRGHLTVSRLLFLGDAFCACFWSLMILCYCFLWTDPLVVIQERSPTLFFVFQLFAFICYVNFVLLRVLVLASKMTMIALGETLSVVVVGHHYYVRVWQPAMLDRPFHGTLFYYFCYAWLFSAFAYNRVQEFAPLKQLRGPRLPFFTWLRVLFARFSAKGVPDGDIENRFLDHTADDDDHQR